MKEGLRVLIAFVVAIAAGAAIAASGNSTLLKAVDFIAPFGGLWVTAIRMTVIPLVVSLLIIGVASAANVKAIGRLGGRTLIVFLLLLTATAAVVVPAGLMLSPLFSHGSGTLPAGAADAARELAAGGQTQTFASWLTSLLPANPVGAAANGAMMPLIFFTLLLALAIAHSSEQSRETLTGFFRALSEAMLTMVRWVILAAPIGVFALVLPLAVSTGGTLAGGIALYVVLYSAACLILTAALCGIAAAAGGISLRRFLRAALPAQLIALSSASSLAALPALFEGAEKGLGLPRRVTGFVLPLAASTFKVGTPLAWTIGAIFVAGFYGVPLHAGAVVTIAFSAVFLSIALPGIPRGAFIMLTPVFLSVGLPVEGVGLLIAVDAIPDAFVTTLNATGYLAATTVVARASVTVADESTTPVLA